MDWYNKFRELGYRVRTQMLPYNGSFNGMILMFHRVVTELGEYRHPQLAQLHVTVRHLESLVVGLRDKGYEIISLDELCNALDSNREKARFVVFTFDDAYRDTYELAYPIFRKHSLPFTVYVPTAVPDNNFIWWHYMLDELIFKHDSLEIMIKDDSHHFDISAYEQKLDAYDAIESLINCIEPSRRQEALLEIFSRYGLDANEFNRKLSMSWEQLGELSRSGLAIIGGHSMNHYNLAQLSLPEARNEMQQDRKRITEKLGIEVDHFSYPFGCKSAAHFREFDIAKKLGFKTCTTSRHGYITAGHRYYLERLPRVMVEETTSLNSLVH